MCGPVHATPGLLVIQLIINSDNMTSQKLGEAVDPPQPTKRRLVQVCEYKVWIKKKGQMQQNMINTISIKN